MSETKNQHNADASSFEADAFAMNKYSRQVGTYGVEAMAKLVKMKVLVIGLKGVGIEAAKNLILAGVGEVTLFDDEYVKISDLGTNFYLKESDVGKNRVAAASLQALKSLNPLVNVKIHNGKLTNKHLKQFTIVLDCGLTNEQAKICNKECRKVKNFEGAHVKYIRSNAYGVVGFVFVDFGDQFRVIDKTGEQPVNRIIEDINVVGDSEKSEDAKDGVEIVIHLLPPPEGKMHNIQDDAHEGWIKFDEVDGELGKLLNNTPEPFRIKTNTRLNAKGKKVFDPYSLKVIVPNRKTVPAYTSGGVINQVKVPVTFTFSSYADTLKNPVHPDEGALLFTDGAKFGRNEQLHIALNGLWEYEKKHKRLPVANDLRAADEVVELAKVYNSTMKATKGAFSVEEVDEEVVKTLSKFAECKLQPLSCFFGGVVAQEVVKFTGKYQPLHQWLYLDCFEILPELFVDENEEKIDVTSNDRLPLNTRYDDLIKIVGLPLHRKLTKSRTFMVGCGALGCEMLKNFALMGVACDEEKAGLITVTDNDQIEISNLSRQFLFRESNVGQSKSLAAGNAVKEMNPNVCVKAMESLVSSSSEHIFKPDFWDSLDFVTNALDNVKARVYVDGQCVLYEKPLLESGTLGTKCNSQIIIPHKTQSYADGPQDDVGDAIPMCTLRNFPSQIEHCIEWARSNFTDLFETGATKASNYLQNPQEWIRELRLKSVDLPQNQVANGVATNYESLSEVHEIIMTLRSANTNFDYCLKQAYAKFHELFRDKVLSLTKAYPADAKDEDGNPFWGGPKRFPQEALFNINDDTHVNFVLSMSNILAATLGIDTTDPSKKRNATHIREKLKNFSPPQVEYESVDLSEGPTSKGPKVTASNMENVVKSFNELLSNLEELATSNEVKSLSVEPAEFEKDDDTNFHIDFIAAASNLRARNYHLKEVSRHTCKMIAGRIIPAVATTTASVTGLVCLELLKLLQPGKKLAAFKDSSNSLAINSYWFLEPPVPKQAEDVYDPIAMAEVTCLPPKFTKWDKVFIAGDDSTTLQEFIDKFKAFHKNKFNKDLDIGCLMHSNANDEKAIGYSTFLYENDETKQEKYAVSLKKPLKEYVREVYGDVLAKSYVRLDATVEDEDGNPYKIPELIFQFA